jgi:hypothetical protein
MVSGCSQRCRNGSMFGCARGNRMHPWDRSSPAAAMPAAANQRGRIRKRGVRGIGRAGTGREEETAEMEKNVVAGPGGKGFRVSAGCTPGARPGRPRAPSLPARVPASPRRLPVPVLPPTGGEYWSNGSDGVRLMPPLYLLSPPAAVCRGRPPEGKPLRRRSSASPGSSLPVRNSERQPSVQTGEAAAMQVATQPGFRPRSPPIGRP